MVFGCVPQFGQLGHALQCHVSPLWELLPGSPAPHSLAHLPPSRPCHLVCGCMSVALILLDRLPRGPAAACAACAAVSLVIPWGTGLLESTSFLRELWVPHGEARAPHPQEGIPGAGRASLVACRLPSLKKDSCLASFKRHFPKTVKFVFDHSVNSHPVFQDLSFMK